MSIRKSQIRIALDQVRTKQGDGAAVAILRQFGATDIDGIRAGHYPQIMRLCGHPELARTAREEHAEANAESREVSAFERVVNGASTLREGFSLAARAVHIRWNSR